MFTKIILNVHRFLVSSLRRGKGAQYLVCWKYISYAPIKVKEESSLHLHIWVVLGHKNQSSLDLTICEGSEKPCGMLIIHMLQSIKF